jgi:small-conductance mechanosensitive channel
VNDLANWLETHNVSLIAVLGTIGLVVGALALSYFIRRALQDSLKRLMSLLRLPYEAVLTLTRVLTAAIWIIAAALVLEIWGMSVGGLWTILVSAATVIGVGFLATWTMVSNVTASFFIAVWRPFHLGDNVEVLPEGFKGRVIDSNLMFLIVREGNGTLLHIPNNLFFQKMFRVTGSHDRTLFEAYELRDGTAAPYAAVSPRSTAATTDFKTP